MTKFKVGECVRVTCFSSNCGETKVPIDELEHYDNRVYKLIHGNKILKVKEIVETDDSPLGYLYRLDKDDLPFFEEDEIVLAIIKNWRKEI